MIRIFLTGYMGAGKTTLGKAFAREMNVPFIDLDWYIEERFHKSIRELFTERGEASFRELERNMLHEVGEFEDVVVSTGGGTPCFFDNMEYMNGCGQTVFLDVHPDILFRRLRVAKQQRPILQGKTDEDLRTFIVEALDKAFQFFRLCPRKECPRNPQGITGRQFQWNFLIDGPLLQKTVIKNQIMSHKNIIPDKLQKFLHCHILFFPQSRHFICNPGQLYYRFRN